MYCALGEILILIITSASSSRNTYCLGYAVFIKHYTGYKISLDHIVPYPIFHFDVPDLT